MRLAVVVTAVLLFVPCPTLGGGGGGGNGGPPSDPPGIGFVILAHSSGTARTAAILVAALSQHPRQRAFVVHMDSKFSDGCHIFGKWLSQMVQEGKARSDVSETAQCVSAVDAQLWEWSLIEVGTQREIRHHRRG